MLLLKVVVLILTLSRRRRALLVLIEIYILVQSSYRSLPIPTVPEAEHQTCNHHRRRRIYLSGMDGPRTRVGPREDYPSRR